MNFVKPLKSKKSERVKSWSKIKEEALELKNFIDAKKFEGAWGDAWAISHCQVSENPKSFFVVNKKKIKEFGHWCIINARIVKSSESVTFKEGCMSFLWRKEKAVNRFANITVRYSTPFLGFLMPRRRTFKNLNAFIFQHEIDHAEGINIYGL